jgi:hypothetical protein
MSTLEPMHKKLWIRYWEETTGFYGVNAMLLIGQISGEKEKIIIARRHYHRGE